MCSRIEELIQTWERTGLLSPEELALVEGHLGQCRRCASAYGDLLPLLRRDAGRASGLAAPLRQLSVGFTERCMERVARTGRAGRATVAVQRRALVLLPLTLALAAGLFIAAGFFAWRWGIPTRSVLVRFELAAPEARNVSLVGDFNGWDPARLVMKDTTGQGNWRIAIRLKKGRLYTYNFLIDGERWITDPNSPRQVDDGFGGSNSILQL